MERKNQNRETWVGYRPSVMPAKKKNKKQVIVEFIGRAELEELVLDRAVMEVKKDIGNKLAQWIMRHIHCYASTFYTCCSRYYPTDIKIMTGSFLNEKEEKD